MVKPEKPTLMHAEAAEAGKAVALSLARGGDPDQPPCLAKVTRAR